MEMMESALAASQTQTFSDCLEIHIDNNVTTQGIQKPNSVEGDVILHCNQGDSDVILQCNQTLKLEVAVGILNNIHQYKAIERVPENPKGGDTYLLIPQAGDKEAWKGKKSAMDGGEGKG